MLVTTRTDFDIATTEANTAANAEAGGEHKEGVMGKVKGMLHKDK
jgi:hypothetical protein